MANIEVAGSLTIGLSNTPLDARSRVSALADIASIASPFVGLHVYVTGTGKEYVVKTLKSKQIGGLTVQNAAVDTYEVIPSKADLDGKADASHTHAISDISGLSESLGNMIVSVGWSDVTGKPETFTPSEHTHADYALATHTHDYSAVFAPISHTHTDYAPIVDGKIPSDNLPENIGSKSAKISLPVPYDENKDNVSLYLNIGTDPSFADGTFTIIRMTDHFAKMKVFYNEQYHTLTEGHVGVPEYGATVSFELDQEIMPGYVSGNTYYARFTWMDSKGAYDDWKGFVFSGDVVVLEPIHTDYKSPASVKAQTEVSGSLALNYLDAEIQNYTMSSDLTVNLSNVSNVPFGEALICNIKRTGGTLSIINGASQQSYTESKTYMVVITNFGSLQIAVTETI